MKHRLSLQAVTQVTDGQGGFTESWATIASVWASINPTNDYEKLQAQQLQTNTTHKVKMRYYRGLTTKHRLLFGTRVFNIKGITNPDESNTFLNLQCVETK